MGRDEDRDVVFAGEVGQALPKAVARHRIDAGCRLVEYQNVGRMDHRHRQRQALADAKRQRIWKAIDDLEEVESFYHFPDTAFDRIRCEPEQARMQFEVLPDRQLGIEREGLRHVADAAADIHVVGIDLVAEQPGCAFARRKQSGQHLHGGRLAAAVRPEKAEDLAAGNAEADIVDRGEIAEPHGELLGLDRDVVGLPHSARRDHYVLVIPTLLLWKQGDEGGVEVICAVCRGWSRRARRWRARDLYPSQPARSKRAASSM